MELESLSLSIVLPKIEKIVDLKINKSYYIFVVDLKINKVVFKSDEFKSPQGLAQQIKGK